MLKIGMVEVSKELSDILDVDEEKDKELIKELESLDCKKEVVFLALIAPHYGIRVSPSKVAGASFGISEEFGVEEVINRIKKQTNCKKLFLLINSPRGYVQSSYKIARALRSSFDEIIVFIPYESSSGGTLISLIGNEIVMGMMSQLSPIDPSSNGTSALSIKRGFQYIMNLLENVDERDLPYPLKSLSQKFEPDELDHALSSLKLMEVYAKEILESGGMEEQKSDKISKKLVNGFLTHSQVINSDKAKEIGLNIPDEKKYNKELDIIRKWLSKYLLKSADKHIIRYYLSKECKLIQKKGVAVNEDKFGIERNRGE